MTDQPVGDLMLRTVAMPADTNPAGDIFGGWLMSLMDLSAGTAASERAKGRTATVSVSNLVFVRPVKIGDVVSVYTSVKKVGRTSITLMVEAWAVQRGKTDFHKVTEAEIVMVALDEHGKSRPVDG